MLRSLRTAEQAMNLHLTRINTLANNLANVDATGFKQVLTRVAEQGAPATMPTLPEGANPAQVVNPLVTPAEVAATGNEAVGALGGASGVATPAPSGATAPGAAAALPLGGARGGGTPPPPPTGLPPGTRWANALPLDMTSALDVRSGPLRETGNMTDLAIQGDGYFTVQTVQGDLYTRDGHFRIGPAGRLVTASGDPVLGGGGPIEIEGGTFSVSADGSVTANGSLVGRLQIVSFADASRLQPRGSSLLAARKDQTATPLPPEQVQVTQGQLEGSNVDPIGTLVEMIAAQRAFEIESRVMQANDENLDKAVNQLPSVR